MMSTNCSDQGGPQRDEEPGAAGLTDVELRQAGWEPCFVADEPRLSEAVETYREIGFEVLLQPVRFDGEQCTDCMRCEPGRFHMIFVRKSPPGEPVE
jgi:hypothetical protein